MINKSYKVLWTSYARVALAQMQPYNIDPMKVFKRTKMLLAHKPETHAYDFVSFPGFKFNGYMWTLIHNVVIVYKVDQEQELVYI